MYTLCGILQLTALLVDKDEEVFRFMREQRSLSDYMLLVSILYLLYTWEL